MRRVPFSAMFFLMRRARRPYDHPLLTHLHKTLKILTNPKIDAARPFMDRIVSEFENGRSLRESRNSIRVCVFEGEEFNVKRYERPRGWRKLVYSLFRTPKGLRAYTYPARLLAAGIETPEAVGYREEREGLWLTNSYFVSRQCPYSRRFYEFAEVQLTPENMEIIAQFAALAARMHEQGILHRDFSPGNILFDQVEGRWHFSLVDTNRMYFGPVSVRRGCENFARLWGQTCFFELLALKYAEARGANAADCLKWMLSARKKFWLRYIRRHGRPFAIDL